MVPAVRTRLQLARERLPLIASSFLERPSPRSERQGPGILSHCVVWFLSSTLPRSRTSCFQNPLAGFFLVFLHLTMAVSLAHPCLPLALSSLWLWAPHFLVPPSPQALLSHFCGLPLSPTFLSHICWDPGVSSCDLLRSLWVT